MAILTRSSLLLLLIAFLLAALPLPAGATKPSPSPSHRPTPSASHKPSPSASHVARDMSAQWSLPFVHVPAPVACPSTTGGTVQCCERLVSASSKSATVLFEPLVIDAKDTGKEVGLTCTAVNEGGVTDDDLCDMALACCSTNSYDGIIALNCTAVDIGI